MTKQLKKAAAAILAAAITIGCGSVGAGAANNSKAKTDELSSAMSKLKNVKLNNKTVKWLAHYDLNPGSNGVKSADVELFEKKYGGKIQWIPTTWNYRYDDLSVNIIGGTGVDIFPGNDVNNMPKGVVSGLFQPVDSYIKLNDSIWKNTKKAMDTYKFGSKHFMFVTDVQAAYYVYYNTKTIKKYGLDDPWELYEKGEWNWDTFQNMLKKYVNEDKERYGLDGWYSELALLYSSGTPAVKSVNGHVVSELNSSAMKKAMDYQYGLYEDGLVLDKALFNWAEQPQMIGSGKQLFRIGGYWEITNAPETWVSNTSVKNLGIAPVPSPKGSKSYQAANLEGYVLCKGASNPKGAALLAECGIVAAYDKNVRKLERQRNMKNYKWSAEITNRITKIDALARKYPVVDLAAGCSTDIANFTTQGGDAVGVRAALHGTKWSDTRESIADAIEVLVKEVDDDLQKEVSKSKK